MENYFGQHGWREFNRNRKDILSEFDKLLEQTKSRPIQVAHGQGVEAFIRKWLSEFLPKKYGVTSGYIIPNLYNSDLKLYHFDIIIYNQFEAPILWTEGNSDQNEQGKYRAIPAKHVMAVYEVKARLTKANVIDALAKLNQTKEFSEQLNKLYSCGILFIDLKSNDNSNASIIKELYKGTSIIGFTGGLVLRFEGDQTSIGNIKVFNMPPKDEIINQPIIQISKPIDSLKIYRTEDGALTTNEQGAGILLVKTSENTWSVSKQYQVSYQEGQKMIHISWSRSNFSMFCIDLLSTLEGLTYNDNNRPSFGLVFDNVELKKAPIQSKVPEKGKPFLELSLYEGNEMDKKLSIKSKSVNPAIMEIKFTVLVKNMGQVNVILSDDSFKHQLELPAGKYALKTSTYHLQLKDLSKPIFDELDLNPLEFPYRIVYYATDTDKDFVSLETQIKIYQNKITLNSN